MKKFLVLLSLLPVAATLVVFLASCDKSDSIVEAYQAAGYDVYTGGVNNSRMDDFDRYLDWGYEELDDLDDYQFLFCYKDDEPAALIVNYFSKSEMKDHLIEEDDGRIIDDEAYRMAEEAGLLKNNCQLVFAVSEEEIDIFQGAE